MSYKRKIVGTSLEEIRLLYFIRQIFPGAINRFKLKHKYTKNAELDIFVPHLNLGIEYDGVYYHSSKRMIKKDTNKNRACEDKGITILRVREKGLEKLSNHDIIYDYVLKNSHRDSFKEVANFINNNFSLTKAELEAIDNLDYDKFEIGPEVLGLYKEIEFKNSLSSKNEKLSKEWNYERNNGLNPDKIKPNTELLVWWKCEKCCNEWQATVHERHRGGKKCLKCKSISTNLPGLIKEWHPVKNGNITPNDVTFASNKKYWWICDVGHEYKTSVHTKSKGGTCPYCSGHKLHEDNSLAAVNPKLSKEWHPTKNGNKTPETVFSSSRIEKAWWQCSKNEEHVWEAKIHTRHQQGQGCPYCVGKKVSKDNSLANLAPELSKQWHLTKNGDLAPSDVTRSSGKMVWWQCKICNHEWEAPINNRVRSSGKCPNCKKK